MGPAVNLPSGKLAEARSWQPISI